MARAQKPDASVDWNRLGAAAAQSGDLVKARDYFINAAEVNRRDITPRLNLALVMMRLGDPALAAITLTEILRLKPSHEATAYRLSGIASRFALEELGGLDPDGLNAAFAFRTVDRQPLAELALRHLKSGRPFLDALSAVGRHGDQAILALVEKRTAEILRNDLFQSALSHGVNRDPDFEPLLTALRRVLLLQVRPDRFTDKALNAFALALARQCTNNEYVFEVGEQETAALAQLPINLAGFLSGDREATRAVLLNALYRPLPDIIGADTTAKDCARIRLEPLRDFVIEQTESRRQEAEIAAGLPRIGTIKDAVSKKVAGQYELSPYPRWTSIHLPSPGSIRPALARFVGADDLAFFDAPFDVLIAGCGTGQQALQSAVGYGDKAKVTAIDISRASLAYAKRMAPSYEVTNVEFALADILGLGDLDRQFDVIECVGVLHHMADPFGGWKILLERLKPGGLIYLGLYSATAREEIAALRSEPGYPGPGCGDGAARNYRQDLMERDRSQAGADLLLSRDFYSLSNFRDLVLHESETHLSLPRIEKFIEQNGLEFRGFTAEAGTPEAFLEQFPDETMPGRLENWARFEQEHPHSFDAMYRFWCQKPR